MKVQKARLHFHLAVGLTCLLSGLGLLLGAAPLAAQNSVVVLGGGPQPSNTTGCSFLPNCILASFDGSSNSHNGDITAPISANFYYAGGAQVPVVPPAAAGTICLADSRMFSGSGSTRATSRSTRSESMWPWPPRTPQISTTVRPIRPARHSLVPEPRITPPMRVCVCPRGRVRPSSPA